MIGVGSPAGDDRLGWLAIEALQADPRLQKVCPEALSFRSLDRPGPGLLPHLKDAHTILLIDALQSGNVPGSIGCYCASTFTAQSTLSSHGFDLPYALDLARTLGLLPEAVRIYTIEAADLDRDAPLSPAVRAALPRLVNRVITDIHATVGHCA